MRRKRSPAQIKADILKVMSEGERLPTHLMYKTNLSWTPMQTRLKEMLRDGLIRVTMEDNPGHRRYSITAKGRWSLKAYRELNEKGL